MTAMPVRHDGRVAPALQSTTHGQVPILVLGAWAALLLNLLPSQSCRPSSASPRRWGGC